MFQAPENRPLPEGYFKRDSGLILPGSVRMIAPGINAVAARGRKTAAAGAAIAYETSNSTASASATPPAGTSGWVIIGFAWRTSSTTAPTVPGGWNSILSGSTNNESGVVAWRYHNGAEGSYTWTSASGVFYSLYSGCHASSPIGDSGGSGATNTTTVTLPSLTIAAATSWVVGIGHVNNAETISGTPSSMTQRQSSSGDRKLWDTNAPVSSFASRTAALSGSIRAYGLSIELLVA